MFKGTVNRINEKKSRASYITKKKTEKILKAVEEGSVWEITFQGTAVRMKKLNAQKQEWKPETVE